MVIPPRVEGDKGSRACFRGTKSRKQHPWLISVITFLVQRLKGEVKILMWNWNSLLGSRGLGLYIDGVNLHQSYARCCSICHPLWQRHYGGKFYSVWWFSLWKVLSLICEFIVSLRCSLDSAILWGKISLRRSGVKTVGMSVKNSSCVLLITFFPPWNFSLGVRNQFLIYVFIPSLYLLFSGVELLQDAKIFQ